MSDDESSMDFLETAQVKKSARGQLQSGIRSENYKTTSRAAGKKGSWAGQYKRRSFPVHPDTLQEMEAQAKKLGVSQNELVRWFFDQGLDSLRKGVKPPVEDVVVQRRITKSKKVTR
jgi:hypothetical protein